MVRYEIHLRFALRRRPRLLALGRAGGLSFRRTLTPIPASVDIWSLYSSISGIRHYALIDDRLIGSTYRFIGAPRQSATTKHCINVQQTRLRRPINAGGRGRFQNPMLNSQITHCMERCCLQDEACNNDGKKSTSNETNNKRVFFSFLYGPHPHSL